MLTMFNDLHGRTVRAQDGVCGRIDDIFFDDRNGTVCHVVVRVGRWPRWNLVLLSPTSVSVDENGILSVAMTCDEVRRAPKADTAPPVSRQHDLQLRESGTHAFSNKADFYGAALAGGTNCPTNLDRMEADAAFEAHHETARPAQGTHMTPFDILLRNRKLEQGQAHLRSIREIGGYEVELECGRAGYVADIWLDLETWQVTHLSLQLRIAKRRVAVPATLVRGISSGTGTIRLGASWGQSSDGPALVPSNSKPRFNLRNWGDAMHSSHMQPSPMSSAKTH